MKRFAWMALVGAMACDAPENHKDASANYTAGSLDRQGTGGDADTAAGAPTSSVCARAQECYRGLTRDLCGGANDCQATLAPPPGHSGQTTCANTLREARDRAKPFMAGKPDYVMPEACRL